MEVPSLARHSGLRIQCRSSCGLSCSWELDLITGQGTTYATWWQKKKKKKVSSLNPLDNYRVWRLGVKE